MSVANSIQMWTAIYFCSSSTVEVSSEIMMTMAFRTGQQQQQEQQQLWREIWQIRETSCAKRNKNEGAEIRSMRKKVEFSRFSLIQVAIAIGNVEQFDFTYP
ncbi:MAG: hypothetical protein MHMPM18_000281 [Marteilia pararefringens]